MIKLPNTIKWASEELTVTFVRSLVGKYIHVTENMLELFTPNSDQAVQENVWFAGRVAGFQQAEMHYDFDASEYTDVDESISLILTDGAGYLLSRSHLVIDEITEEEFFTLLGEFNAKEAEKLLALKEFNTDVATS
ncbi:MAG: hypothetical protein J7639_14755 [Paenibacillaceae bacterium]|nr:hypothetical protein [Paenibacillaceae bacterium]